MKAGTKMDPKPESYENDPMAARRCVVEEPPTEEQPEISEDSDVADYGSDPDDEFGKPVDG